VNCQSLLKKILNESTWKRNYLLRTTENYNINDIIQAGLDNPDHPIGVIACSKDSYYTFDEILLNTAKQFHNKNINLQKFEKENYALLKSIISNLDELFKNHLLSVEIQNLRNISNFPFSSKISRSERREVVNIIVNILKKLENEIFGEGGKFIDLGIDIF